MKVVVEGLELVVVEKIKRTREKNKERESICTKG